MIKYISHGARHLKDLATIKGGVHFSSGIKADPVGDLSVIQAGDVDESGTIHYGQLKRLEKSDTKVNDLLSPGNILFKAKSTRPIAALVDRDDHPTIATSHFFILRIHDQSVLPAYLVWALNHPAIRAVLESRTTGSVTPFVTKKVLGNLAVPIPPLKTQEVIIALHRLQKRELTILTDIRDRREALTHAVLYRAATHPDYTRREP